MSLALTLSEVLVWLNLTSLAVVLRVAFRNL
jgi:hypothetical protein